jgi:Lon-like protease
VPPTPAPGPAVSALWWFTGPVLLVLLAVVTMVLSFPAPYYALLPGSATAVEPSVSITDLDGEPIDVDGEARENLLFLTVTLRQPSGLETLLRTLDDTAEVVAEDLITGGQTREENRRFNLALMTDSKDRAAKVALERAGYEVPVVDAGAVVLDLDPTFPVARVLRPGDTIVAIDGAEVPTSDAVREALAGSAPGDVIEVEVEAFADDERRTETTRLGADPADAAVARLGVSLADRPRFEFPLAVEIDSGDVGGPSAGLAFVLAVLDRLTPGNLVGDEGVAVTGSVTLEGQVGSVGGVPQKTEAAIREGASVFIVPDAELTDALEAARGRIEVRPVATVDDALDVLEEFGGVPVPAEPKVADGPGE